MANIEPDSSKPSLESCLNCWLMWPLQSTIRQEIQGVPIVSTFQVKTKSWLIKVDWCLFIQGDLNPTVVINLNLFNFLHVNFLCDTIVGPFERKKEKKFCMMFSFQFSNGHFFFKFHFSLEIQPYTNIIRDWLCKFVHMF